MCVLRIKKNSQNLMKILHGRNLLWHFHIKGIINAIKSFNQVSNNKITKQQKKWNPIFFIYLFISVKNWSRCPGMRTQRRGLGKVIWICGYQMFGCQWQPQKQRVKHLLGALLKSYESTKEFCKYIFFFFVNFLLFFVTIKQISNIQPHPVNKRTITVFFFFVSIYFSW